MLPVLTARKLFTFVVTLNTVGLVFAACGHFSYAEKWTSAMALGNLNAAILVRNELFGRFLYWFVNTFFAKVSIPLSYPLSLCLALIAMDQWTPLWWRLGCTSLLQVIPPFPQTVVIESHDDGIAASRRHSQRLCTIWHWMARSQGCEQLSAPYSQP